jgi:hypothetical protein
VAFTRDVFFRAVVFRVVAFAWVVRFRAGALRALCFVPPRAERVAVFRVGRVFVAAEARVVFFLAEPRAVALRVLLFFAAAGRDVFFVDLARAVRAVFDVAAIGTPSQRCDLLRAHHRRRRTFIYNRHRSRIPRAGHGPRAWKPDVERITMPGPPPGHLPPATRDDVSW